MEDWYPCSLRRIAISADVSTIIEVDRSRRSR
jgi:hypothetical protein